MKYKIEKTSEQDGVTEIKIGFGENNVTNCEIVVDAEKAFIDAEIKGGRLLKINGPASLPVGFVLAHLSCHIFGAVAVYDPKLSGYVVAVSHDPDYSVGGMIGGES